MIDKVKVSVWDFFVYILIGNVTIVSVVVHCLVFKQFTFQQMISSSIALTTIIAILLMFILGLMIEPISNLLSKVYCLLNVNLGEGFCCRIMKKWKETLSFSQWDKDIKTLSVEASKYIPEGVTCNHYQYCKNYILQKGDGSLFNSFLAKFGFYRNLFFIMLLNSLLCCFLYSSHYNFLILLWSLVYLHRSRMFYRHMSMTVYNQFISLHESLEKES